MALGLAGTPARQRTAAATTTAGSVSEGLGLSDTFAATATIGAAVTESIALGEAPGGAGQFPESVTESYTLDDTVTAVLSAVAGTIAEGLALGETWAANLVAAALVTESLALSDAKSATQLGVIEGAVTEALAVSDAFSAAMTGVSAVAESLAFSDTWGGTLPGATPPEDDDTDTAVGTYIDCEGYRLRPRRLHFQHALNDARNAALTGYSRLPLDMHRVHVTTSLPNRGAIARMAFSSRRAGEAGSIRSVVLYVQPAISASRISDDTSQYTDSEGYEIGVPEWQFYFAANDANNASLSVGVADQDAIQVRFDAPLNFCGSAHRFGLSTLRAGRAGAVSRLIVYARPLGENTATGTTT